MSTTRETIAWTLKNLILPLAPTICGSVTRYLYSGEIVFDISELAFSIAILYTILLKSIGSLNDKNLIESLASVCFFGVFICLTIFTYATLVKLQSEHKLLNLLTAIQGASTSQPDKIPQLLSSYNSQEFSDTMTRVKQLMYVVAIISIPTTISFKVRYKIE